MVNSYDLLGAFFMNFEYYMTKVFEYIEKAQTENPTLEVNTLSDKVLADKFIHSE